MIYKKVNTEIKERELTITKSRSFFSWSGISYIGKINARKMQSVNYVNKFNNYAILISPLIFLSVMPSHPKATVNK